MKTIKLIILSVFILSANALLAKGESDTLNFKVYGNCEMCQERIEEALDVRGVKSAHWNVESKMIEVVYDKSKITEDKIHTLIAEAGYDTDKKKAKDYDYKNLPGCCQYERAKEVKP